MKSYLLSEEKLRIEYLLGTLCGKLGKNIEELSEVSELFLEFIKENKDASIQDILNAYFGLFETKMQDLLDEKITPGIQFGIQNDYFSAIGYGGKYNGSEDAVDIQRDTFFSFDSISKILISILAMREVRDGKIDFSTPICDYCKDFSLQSSLEDVLKFTALIRTEKRIDGLSKEETLALLKSCRENIEEKSKYKNFYQYNDIGYMILRQCIPDCLDKLDQLLKEIDPKNLTYKWNLFMNQITGGKLNQEFITPDLKGREIYFPGHAGMYGNIKGLLNLFEKFLYTEDILTEKERTLLFAQPYVESVVYDKDGNQVVGKNQSLQYMTKVAGIYRETFGVDDPNYRKLASCDMSHLTTHNAKASTGTCGSWVVGDDLVYEDHFGSYVGGLVTNPYSYISVGNYPSDRNVVPNTNLEVNAKGVILGYQGKLNPYKEWITECGLLLELITEYIKLSDPYILENTKYTLTKKIR